MNIIELTREVGIYDGREGLMWCSKEQLERFAALVRAEALEEAAKEADKWIGCDLLAAAIRG